VTGEPLHTYIVQLVRTSDGAEGEDVRTADSSEAAISAANAAFAPAGWVAVRAIKSVMEPL
jgi:hypothetical protein